MNHNEIPHIAHAAYRKSSPSETWERLQVNTGSSIAVLTAPGTFSYQDKEVKLSHNPLPSCYALPH